MNNIESKNNIFMGKVIPVSIRMSIPLFISNLLMFFYVFVDMYFISQIDKSSTAYLSGSGLVFPFFFVFFALGLGVNVGVSALIARGIGEKNEHVVSYTADSGLLFVTILSVLTLILGYLFADQIVNVLAGPRLSKDAIQQGLIYYKYLLPGLAVILFMYALAGVLQGEGLMKYVARASMLAFILNIVLDPILIFGLKMDIAGAGLATSLSYFISTLYLVVLFIKKKSNINISWNIFNAKKNIVKEILNIGIPQSLGVLSISIMYIFLNYIASSLGDIQMTSWSICYRADRIMLLPLTAISATTLTMVGQNYGRNDIDRVRLIHKENIKLGTIVVIILAVIYNLIAPLFFSVMSNIPKVVDLAVTQVRFVSLTYVGVIIAYVSTATFQATGKPIIALLIQIFRMGIFVIPLAIILVYYYKIGMYGLFISLGAGNVMLLVISLIWSSIYLKKLEFKKVS